MDEEWGIGKNGTLPWPANKEDLKQFKEKTTGHLVVMGSNTWNDPCFPAPLKNRTNYIVTSKTEGFDGGIILPVGWKREVIRMSKNTQKDVWIIGGKRLIEACWDIIEEFHLTVVNGVYDCDVFLKFPWEDFSLTSAEVTDRNVYYTYRRAV